jgi:hypothetical protein
MFIRHAGCSCRYVALAGTVLANFHLAPASNFGDQVANGVMTQQSHVFSHDMNWIFSPRVGVAYDPTGSGKWVARGGFGLFHNEFTTHAILVLLLNRQIFKVGQMGLWNDPIGWAKLCSGANCPICIRREPLDIVAKLEVSWITMPEAAPIQGYVCLVSQGHAVELHDLDDTTATAFMREAQKVSKALATATGAVKLNYEIHGNSLPHLRMHFFPRYR